MAKFNFGTKVLDLSTPKVMGILNVTPDSFSDGGQYTQLDTALYRAEQILNEGASIIDIGGESTRPGAQPVSTQEELDRVIPIVEAISKRLNIIISIDTSKVEVIQACSNLNIGLINDIRALQCPNAMKVVSNLDISICLMHMQGEPESMQNNPSYEEVTDQVYLFLAQRIQACHEMGISNQRIIVDPGFGFGKSIQHNYQLLAKLAAFQTLGLPILAGLSRKSMLSDKLYNQPVHNRSAASLAAATIAAYNGANIIRAHDVAETVDALNIVALTQKAKTQE